MKKVNIEENLHEIVGDFTWNEPTCYTSLFQSCGIGEYYLKKHLGLVATLSNEIVHQRARWSQEIYPDCEVVHGDIWNDDVFEKLVRLHKEKGNTGIMCSCPCQSYTLSSPRRNPSDKRGRLFERSLEFIKRTDPDWVIFENVPQLFTAKLYDGRIIGDIIIDTLKSLGYHVTHGVQNAANFYTPQNRRRAIILARKSKVWNLPISFDEVITLRQAIGDLPVIEAGEDSGIKYHVAPMWALPQIEVMKHIPTGCSAHDNSEWKPVNADGTPSHAKFRCSFQRKAWDEPCNTILCDSKGVSGFRNVHPGNLLPDGTYDSARCLTVLELLRVTGLPDDYPIPTWAKDKLIRDAMGECFAPLHVLAIMKGLFD